uniref:Integrase catalytic domain-containing protein n=1 Tax=Amphimedon queenslandica TaxID=400682 RepID=A0A1X7U610_AMPQE
MSFSAQSESKAKEPLDIVHSDICGKINSKSLSGAEYFLTLIHGKTRFVWVYVLKRKSDVFSTFCEWKASVNGLQEEALKFCERIMDGSLLLTSLKNT